MLDTEHTIVSVQYERKFSDGNYGSEGLSLSWTVTYEDPGDAACDGETAAARCQEIGGKLRLAVLSFLTQSASERVAYMAERELAGAEPAVGRLESSR